MKFLNVAEKNDAAKTIAGHLSNGTAQRREGLSKFNKLYEFQHDVLGHRNANMCMTSVSGHLLTQEFGAEYRNWQRVDPMRLFEAPITKACPPNFADIKRTLEREIRGAHGLIIWTDCDREGENIGFEIIDVCRAVKPNMPVYRAKFSEITAVAVRRALANLVQPDELQSKAVDVRSELDLRIGAAFTRFQTMRYRRLFPAVIEKHLVSYGSCQIPTLGFVAKRFKEVEAFQPQQFWKLRMTHTIDALTVDWLWARNRLFDEQCCAAIFELCRATEPLEATVTSVTEKGKNKWRPCALDTIELEKLGSKKLKMSAKQTMTVAEKLYTQGYISYPRTETNAFSKEMELRPLVEHQVAHPAWGAFAARVLNEWGTNPRNGNKSDAAHPPIHPTKAGVGLSGDEQRVYELVVRHFLACVSRDATGAETVVTALLGDEEFTATGLCIYERNYLEVYIYEKWNAKEIHAYEAGQTFVPTVLEMRDGRTSAPDLLTEAELIAMMDKHGIGTDATHAEHINTIVEREYIGKINGGFLVPGKLGMGLVEGYEAVELPLAQPELRAGLEKDLQAICAGRRPADEVLAEQVAIYRNAFRVITERAQRMDEPMARRLETTAVAGADAEQPQHEEQVAVAKCPRCDSTMTLKRHNESFCMTCLNYPVCKHTIWLPGSVVKEASVVEDATRRCARCRARLVAFRLRSVRHTAGLEPRRVQEDGVTYVTCVMCDVAFQEQCFISADAFRPAVVESRPRAALGNARPPTAATAAQPTTAPPSRQQPQARQRPTATINPVPAAQRNRPQNGGNNGRQNSPPRTWVNPNASGAGRQSFGGGSTKAMPPPPPPSPPGGAATAEIRCTKCQKVPRK